MDTTQVVSPQEWSAARKQLLAREKEATRAKDAADAARRELPATEVTKDYIFTGPGGRVSLPGLFDGRRQLITYHFMWRHEQSGFPGRRLYHRRGPPALLSRHAASSQHLTNVGEWAIQCVPGCPIG